MAPHNSDLIVIATAKAKSGSEADLERALLEAAGPTRRQPGCVSFSLLHSLDDPAVIVGFERWASDKDHDRHLQGAHVQTLMAKMGPLLAEPPQIRSFRIADEM